MMIRFLYQKWIRRRCPHICACCRFKKEHYTECFTEMEQRERRATMEDNKERLDGAVSLIIYLIDVLLVTIFISGIITGESSVVTKVFMIEAVVMAGIGFVLVMRAGRY